MKITDLNEFSFYIGNTSDGLDVVATNEGIAVDDEIDGFYDDNDIIDAHDLCNAIDDAIKNCKSLTKEDKEELGTYLGAEIDIKNWWENNYE
jgi:hypothetical protein